MADPLPDPEAVVLALATLPKSQRLELAHAYLVFAAQAGDGGDLHLARVYLELAKVVARATELAPVVARMADRMIHANLTPPPMLSAN